MRFFLFFLFFLPVCIAVADQEHDPSINFPETSKDFGKVDQGVKIRQIFSFTNEGESVLEIVSLGHT
jgi:hypothetical protein